MESNGPEIRSNLQGGSGGALVLGAAVGYFAEVLGIVVAGVMAFSKINLNF